MSCLAAFLLVQITRMPAMRMTQGNDVSTRQNKVWCDTNTSMMLFRRHSDHLHSTRFWDKTSNFHYCLAQPWRIPNFTGPPGYKEKWHTSYEGDGYYCGRCGPNDEGCISGPMYPSQATANGITTQMAIEVRIKVDGSYLTDLGPECIRLSDSPECKEEGKIVKIKDGFLLLSDTVHTPLKFPNTHEADQAIGNWASRDDSFTISTPDKQGGAPRFVLTRCWRNDGWENRTKWHGELGEPDANSWRWVELAASFKGSRRVGVRQLTPNSMQILLPETYQADKNGVPWKNPDGEFAVRAYEPANTSASAFVCARSTNRSRWGSWEAIRGFSWNYQSPQQPNPSGEIEKSRSFTADYNLPPFSDGNYFGPRWRLDSGARIRTGNGFTMGRTELASDQVHESSWRSFAVQELNWNRPYGVGARGAHPDDRSDWQSRAPRAPTLYFVAVAVAVVASIDV